MFASHRQYACWKNGCHQTGTTFVCLGPISGGCAGGDGGARRPRPARSGPPAPGGGRPADSRSAVRWSPGSWWSSAPTAAAGCGSRGHAACSEPGVTPRQPFVRAGMSGGAFLAVQVRVGNPVGALTVGRVTEGYPRARCRWREPRVLFARRRRRNPSRTLRNSRFQAPGRRQKRVSGRLWTLSRSPAPASGSPLRVRCGCRWALRRLRPVFRAAASRGPPPVWSRANSGSNHATPGEGESRR